MASTFTAVLKFNKPALGDAGWGTAVNGGFTDLADQALGGQASIDVGAGAGPFVLTIPDGASGDARNMFIRATGTPGGAREIQVPTNRKLYFVTNDSDGAVTVKVSGQTGVVVPVGASMALRIDSAGTDVGPALTYQASMTLGTALAAASGGTGQSSYAVGDLLYADTTTTLDKLASVAEGSVLRAKGVGTAPAWEQVDLTTDVTGVLPAANGGTGAATLAANNVLLGNGTSAVQEVAPGADGNVLTAGSGTWASSAPPAKSLGVEVFAATTTWTAPAGVTQLRITAAGGGGGGGAVNVGGEGGGGGFGGFASAIISVTPATVYEVTIGDGGVGTNTTGVNGTAGTETWFGVNSGSKLVSCTGGAGGVAATGSFPGTNGADGSSTVTGTVIRSGTNSLGDLFGGSTTRRTTTATALAWSVSSAFAPGTGGRGETTVNPTNDVGGGLGGAIMIEYVG